MVFNIIFFGEVAKLVVCSQITDALQFALCLCDLALEVLVLSFKLADLSRNLVRVLAEELLCEFLKGKLLLIDVRKRVVLYSLLN